jgi:hypothetical protein
VASHKDDWNMNGCLFLHEFSYVRLAIQGG